jgi:heat-inducible transcriptional repressor
MLRPAVCQILKNNESTYSLVIAVAKRAREITDNAFEEKKPLADFIEEVEKSSDETGIQVYIGNESPVQSMKDCSVVTATYDLGEGMRGTVGVIGPKRMDYDKVVGALKNMMRALDDLYKKE